MDTPVLPIKEEHAGVLQVVPLEPFEHGVVVPVPQLHGDIEEVIQLPRREHKSLCTSSQNVDVPVPQTHEDIAQVTAFPSSGAVTHTGSVKKWIKDQGFGLITPDDGERRRVHPLESAGFFDGLQHGGTVSYDTEFDDHKRT